MNEIYSDSSCMYLLVSLSRKSRSRFHHQSRNPEFPRPMIPSPENRDSGPGFRDFRDSRFPDRVTLGKVRTDLVLDFKNGALQFAPSFPWVSLKNKPVKLGSLPVYILYLIINLHASKGSRETPKCDSF